jgi:hypothetical protein
MRQVLAMFVSRKPCLRLRRLTSLRDRRALAEVGRRLKEGIVTVEAE